MPTKRGTRAPCRPNDAPSLHERLIRELVAGDPRVGRNGFWRAHEALVDTLDLDWDFEGRPFLPDAYLFDHEKQQIQLFEVEISSPLSDKKLHDYGWFWFLWDCVDSVEWLPKLFIVDRYGARNELDLCQVYLRICVGGARDMVCAQPPSPSWR